MKNTFISLSVTMVLSATIAACSVLPDEAYYTRGQPESLLSVSKEGARFRLDDRDSVKRIMKEAKSKYSHGVSLKCDDASKVCNKLEKQLSKEGISTTRVASRENVAVISYNHVTARECNNHYVDNMINPYNLNHPTFGCSVASNSVMMVSDRHQYTDPKVLENSDAPKAAQVFDTYKAAPKIEMDFDPIVTSATVATSSGSR